MSSDADAEAAALVAFYYDAYTDWYCAFAATVLFLYNAIITFDQEVALFWSAKLSGASVLFFANKYISVLVYVINSAYIANFPSDEASNPLRCSWFTRVFAVLVPLQVIPWAVFSALRAYVLGKSKLLALFILVLYLAPAAANLVPYGYQMAGENIPPFGCAITDTISRSIAITIISRVPLIVADILLVCITWSTLSSRRLLHESRQTRRRSFSSILLGDGTSYFIILSIMNIIHLTLTLVSLETDEDNASNVATFTAPITAILVSRFLVQLQEANRSTVRVDADDPLQSSRDPNDTASFISSLGGFINPDLVASHDDDTEVPVGPELEVLEREIEGEAKASGSQGEVIASPSSA